MRMSLYGIWIMRRRKRWLRSFIWKSTSAFFNIAEGSKVRLRGTVKEHSDYKGTKQTILQRCKVDAVKL